MKRAKGTKSYKTLIPVTPGKGEAFNLDEVSMGEVQITHHLSTMRS